MKCLSFVFALMFASCSIVSSAAAADSAVDFAADIYSVLRKSCFECHGAEKQAGNLRLDRPESLFESGSVVAGEPEHSELLRRVTLPRGHSEVMPAIGDPLTLKQVNAFRKWIAAGAEWPKDFRAAAHWSYVAPVLPEVPQHSPRSEEFVDWVRSPIDAFVLNRLGHEDLQPSELASPETQIRRAFLDLIGLPPTPAEVDAFVANPSDVAFAAIVDDLLNRPQFGERWARPWLDLARYADSHGFQRDNFREIWAYRDWVIQALNDDMSFQQFTLEQIAGDLLPNATESQHIATGFHRCTPTNVEAGSLPEETRTEQVIDRVNTTGAVWLGSTFECCQCHDHKYDPFTAKDYYQLLAFFNNTEMEADRANPASPSSIKFNGPTMDLSNPALQKQRTELAMNKKQLAEELSAQRQSLATDLSDWAIDYQLASKQAPQTHILRVVDFQSRGQKDDAENLNDGSVLLSGKNPPATDVYAITVEVDADLKDVRAFQLETLAHDRLPGKGPGRGDNKRSNFVLNHFAAFAQNSTARQPLEFASAIADFSQTNWDVVGALNNKPKTGWAIAPQFGKSHWAKFLLKNPRDVATGQKFTFELTQQFGGARNIGCLRLSALTGKVTAETKAVPKEVLAAVKLPAGQWTQKQRNQLVAHRAKTDPVTLRLNGEIATIDKQLAKLKPDTTLVMIELAEPRMSYVYERGDYRKQGERVEPGVPTFLHTLPQGPKNRISLAKWLTAEENPLVARVTVNRWWAELFGRGLVSTPEDFGIKGELPSHPQLLDWLAVTFMEDGWSMKKLLRQIVLSSTYRQSSRVTAAMLERDDQNKLLGRGPSFRMDAEMIRDNILASAGLLSLKQFGPSIKPFQPAGIWSKVGGESYKYEVSAGEDQYRRGLYVVIKRGAPYPSFINFDASARLACTVQRSRTNTPLQALTLLNDPVYVEAAHAMAKRVLVESPRADVRSRVNYAFQLCTSRQPTDDEADVLMDLLETQHSVYRSQPAAVAKLVTGIALPSQADAAEFAAWCSVTTTLINLHETITKP